VDTLQQVVAQEPVPPRRLQPKVPRDLETVCLKCLAKDPQGRYASAAELADDLGRYLNSQPIRAQPPSAWEHARKFARRNKAGLAAAALVAVALLVLASGAGWVLRDRAARQAETERLVHEALQEAGWFQQQSRWVEAREAAKRAEG